MLTIPITIAPRNEAKTIPNSNCIVENLVRPPNAPRAHMEAKARRGTLNNIAKPIAAIPAQKLLVIISKSIIL
jgi:hypothetical protein